MEVRIKFTTDIYIKGKNLKEIREKFEEMPIYSADALEEGFAEFGDIEYVDDAETYEDYTSEYNHAYDNQEEDRLTEYQHIGYYNDIDAVMMNGASADKIVENMQKGIGCFYNSDDCVIVNDADINDWYHKFSSDGKYVVVYDVADRFEHIPLESVKGNAQDEYIDIYKIC